MSEHDPIETGHRALRESCGLVERPADLVEIRDDDRIRFLNGYVTCDFKSLGEGAGTYGFVTEVKGHILADVRVLVMEESLWLDLPAGKGEEITAHLKKYVIADRVHIVTLPAVWKSFTVAGARTAEVLALGELPEDEYSHLAFEIDGCWLWLVREADLDGVAVWTLWSSEPEEVHRILSGRGVQTVPPEALERLRVEAGRPLFGRDFGPDNFPQETGNDDAVSYEKGCYLGQEVVARIHHRGGVARRLRGLRLVAGDAVGRKLVHDGRGAGVVTSATRSPRYGEIGLAIVHKRVEPGESVELEGGGTAIVCELPFLPFVVASG